MRKGTVYINIQECANGFIISGHLQLHSYGPCTSQPSGASSTYIAKDWSEAKVMSDLLKSQLEQSESK